MLPRIQHLAWSRLEHGTDTTLLALMQVRPGHSRRPDLRTRGPAGPSLEAETQRVFDFGGSIEVIHNFFAPRPPRRSREEVRRELGLREEVVVLHSSNLRSGKRIDLLLETVARVRPRGAFRLLILAGEPFAPFTEHVRRLGLADRVIVREKVTDIEDYLQVADVGLFTSETESFCLSILEAMCSAARASRPALGDPEVVEDNRSGLLVRFGDSRCACQRARGLIPRQDPPGRPREPPSSRRERSPPRSSCRATKHSTGGCVDDASRGLDAALAQWQDHRVGQHRRLPRTNRSLDARCTARVVGMRYFLDESMGDEHEKRHSLACFSAAHGPPSWPLRSGLCARHVTERVKSSWRAGSGPRPTSSTSPKRCRGEVWYKRRRRSTRFVSSFGHLAGATNALSTPQRTTSEAGTRTRPLRRGSHHPADKTLQTGRTSWLADRASCSSK